MEENIIALKDYFKKLQKVVDLDSVFKFCEYRLIKKNRVDDIVCCIYATLPAKYKQILKTKDEIAKFKSVASYDRFSKHMTNTFFLNKNLYIINSIEINRLTSIILSNIERDISMIEKNY